MNERYTKQISVPEIGLKGQKKIAEAKVLIIGAGGLGTPVAIYLAAAGVGKIVIVDGDKIDESNLHRQIAYKSSDISKYKALVLKENLVNQNNSVHIDAIAEYLTEENANSIITSCDIVCDCTDNPSSRLLIDKLCNQFNIPTVYGAVGNWKGYVTVLHYKKGFVLNDIISVDSLNKMSVNNNSFPGIVNTVCGICANIQANEVIKLILAKGQILDGYIFCFNALNNEYEKFKLNEM